MWEFLSHALETTLEITVIIFILMVTIDFLDVWFKGYLKRYIHSRPVRQWTVSTILGALPGCAGAYANVTMYMHGFLSLGALTAGMIATTGDEAFVMLAEFPVWAVGLTAALFLLGMLAGAYMDKLLPVLGVKQCPDCTMHTIHEQDRQHDWRHYFRVHIWKHILLGHVAKIALWTFISVLFIDWGMARFSLQSFMEQHPALIIILAVLVGLLPISGPHLVFVTLFAGGLIPFSILWINSIVQDGHAMLPMLSFSIKDVLFIKLYKIILALLTGGVLYLIGL
ncbi:MAG: selenocysteine protein [Calditrichaeota bacterium]|nr:MAG: selenocysteine protein [Calditrichota bacterium]